MSALLLKKLVAASHYSLDRRNIQISVRAIRFLEYFTRNAHNERILETRIYLNKYKPHLSLPNLMSMISIRLAGLDASGILISFHFARPFFLIYL